MLIGITGSSGSGKSTVSEEFVKCGIPVIDADLVSREVVAPGKPALLKIAEVFGSEYISSEGTLCRKELGRLVFSDREALARLNTLLMPYIDAEMRRKIAECDATIVALDAPLLIEYGMDKQCDFVIAVVAEEEKRNQRLQKRDFLSEQEIGNRILSQNKDKFYLEKADYIVYNNSTRENLVRQIRKIIDQLRKKI